MIRRSSTIAAIAIVLSLLVHLMGLNIAPVTTQSQPAVASDRDVVELGNAFEDLAETVAQPVEPEPAPKPEPQAEEPPEPEPAESPTSQALVASANPQRVPSPDTGTVPVVQPETAGAAEPEEGTTAPVDTLGPSDGEEGQIAQATRTPPVGSDDLAQAPKGTPDAATQAVDADGAAEETDASDTADSPADPAQQLAALPPLQTPVPPVAVAPAPPVDLTVPLEPETSEPDLSERPDAPEDPNQSQTDSLGGSILAVATSLRPRLPGRRPTESSAGVSDGAEDDRDLSFPSRIIESPLALYKREGVDVISRGGGRRSGGFGSVEARGPGNATETNYAGRVLVHLNRVPAARLGARGFARVFFDINPDGSLASVGIIDSSGSDDVNRAARAHVRSAAPFPLPPGGKRRKLTFVYQIN